jgi:pyruvate formate lyase activating enzyme
MKEAMFYIGLSEKKVQCTLCPHQCIIEDGNTGNCRVRTNYDGSLIAKNYGKITGFHSDPIEKKPLYHYYPGKHILSIGSVGCNLHCKFCQNYEIAQTGVNGSRMRELSPDSIVNDAMRLKNNIGIAYTYNEPLVFYEFMRDTALLCKQYGLKNVMVTNGFFMQEPLKRMLHFIDAFSIDLKAFTEDFYKKTTFSELRPVKEALKSIADFGKFFEITNLVIPGLNDDILEFTEMMKWISGELGEDIVLHLSRYFPKYKLSVPPTPTEKILELFEIANEYLDYVYIGNMSTAEGQNTKCPICQTLVIERNGYHTSTIGLDENGNCAKCKHKIVEHI